MAGGSVYCYAYEGCCAAAASPPAEYGSCESWDVGGCPSAWTESTFDDCALPYTMHAPTLLLQYDKDPGADQDASWKYMSSLLENGAVGCIYTQAGEIHTMPLCAVRATVAFVSGHIRLGGGV